MIYKLSDLADIHSGVVLSRKEVPADCSAAILYQRLTLRALTESGNLLQSELEQFFSREKLDGDLVTAVDDVIVRLCTPINPFLIDRKQAGYLIPSQLAAIRVKDRSLLLPAYLRWYLSQKSILEALQAAEHGTAQRTIKVKSIADLEIALPPIEIQKQISEIDILSRKREQLYQELIFQERIFSEHVIDTIMGGSKQ